MKQETLRQCMLERNGSRQVSWIPSENARFRNTVRLKEDGKWTEGWNIIEVYDGELSAEVVQARSRDFKNHRKATDV